MNPDLHIVYIDPKNRQLFVAPNAETNGGYSIYAQDAAGHRRLLRGNGVNKTFYASKKEAMNHLDCYVSVRESESPSYAHFSALVNGKEVSMKELHSILSGDALIPAAVPQSQLVTLGNIEYRMSLALNQMQAGYLELGRCLIEAKEAGLVPHGRWEAWVREHALMSERQAQKLMQIARSVPDGSAMARLSVSKVQALMALPQADREEMAERAESENMTLVQLQNEVKAAKAHADQLARGLANAQQRATAAIADAERARADLGKLQAAADAEEQSYQRQIWQLQQDLQDARLEALRQPTPVGISPEAQKRIDQLTQDLQDAEAYAEQQAELRQQAQQQLLQQQADAAHGDTSRSFSSFDLAASVRAFIGTAGVLPHMGAALSSASAAERQELRQYVDMMDTWVQGARQALSTYVVDD